MTTNLAAEKKVFSDLIRQTQVSAKISRLSAQENITVQYSNEVETASFDIVRRVLIYPYSLVLEDEVIHDLLMGHEIGHARFTTTAEEMRERQHERIFEYWNIIEDIRIEKLQKRDYPGLRGTFQLGYQKLFHKGWFGDRDVLRYAAFATRLNFFCKAGPTTAWFIRFNAEERDFLRRCEEVETEEQVHALAIELSEMAGHDRQRSKQMLIDARRALDIERSKWRAWNSIKKEERQQVLEAEAEEESEEEAEEPAANENDGVIVTAPKTEPTVAGDKTEDGAEHVFGGGGSITKTQADGFIRKNTELSEEDTRLTEKDVERFEKLSHAEENLLDEALGLDPMGLFQKKFMTSKVEAANLYAFESIDRKEINIPDARGMYRAVVNHFGIDGHFFQGENASLDQMNAESVEVRKSLKKAVDYLARQFDAKKAAARSKHAVISTSGQLDINRVFSYRYSEDVFLKKTVIRDAKNHGIVLMLDASTSIRDYWEDMVKQVLLITEFCRKVQIPFKVFIFGADIEVKLDKYRPHPVVKKEEKDETRVSNPLLGWRRDKDCVFEVLSSEMTSPEYRTMVGALLNMAFFSLGGTPTTNAILNLESIMNEFFQRHSVSIKKLFIVTDGGAGDGAFELRAHGEGRCFVADPKTRKNYYITSKKEKYSQSVVDIVAKIYKDRYGIETIHIALGHRDDVWKIKHLTNKGYRWTEKTGMAKDFGFESTFDGRELYRAYKKQNFLLKTTPLGIPVFFVKPTKAMTEVSFNYRTKDGFKRMIVDTKTQQMREMNIKELADEFATGMASMKSSQTFLSILTKYISVEVV